MCHFINLISIDHHVFLGFFLSFFLTLFILLRALAGQLQFSCSVWSNNLCSLSLNLSLKYYSIVFQLGFTEEISGAGPKCRVYVYSVLVLYVYGWREYLLQWANTSGLNILFIPMCGKHTYDSKWTHLILNACVRVYSICLMHITELDWDPT